ncbi:MAG: glycosyltransferase family 2 protein [Deltaproteobacteria bacterium]|nr:glycosyltransferase family 2 protein [Deltaproteobacteria bacterium]MBW2396878.1 glycosyltransferase family 2 protein [Deltaproteobacteria bacterium]
MPHRRLESAVIVIIPAYNEETRIGPVIEAIRSTGLDLEIAVIDDGSRDGTAEAVTRAGAIVIRHPFNMGYGAALQTGYKYALRQGADLLIQMDADGQHDPEQIPRLAEPILRGECDLVIGSRFLVPTGYEMGALRTLGRRVFQGLGRIAGVEVTDPTSGYQALNRKVLALYARDDFPHDFPDIDVLLMAARSGLRIQEVPATMQESPRASTLHGGWRAFYYVYKMLLSMWALTARPKGKH